MAYPSAAEFEQDVDIICVVEKTVKTDDVIVSQTAMNADLLR